MNQIVSTLPRDVRAPIISKIALDEIPILRMGVTSSMQSREFYQFLKDHVQPRISQIAGVGQVTLVGGDQKGNPRQPGRPEGALLRTVDLQDHPVGEERQQEAAHRSAAGACRASHLLDEYSESRARPDLS